MAKSSANSAFDELFDQLGDEDKSTLSSLAEKYPKVKEYGLRQSDYNRKQDELRVKTDFADRMGTWAQENWIPDPNDPEKGETVGEKFLREQLEATRREKEALEQQVAFGGLGDDDVNFAQLETQLGDYIKKNNIATADTVKEQIEAGRQKLTTYLDKGFGPVVLTTQEVQLRHFKEFGEILGSEEFLAKASASGTQDMKGYYESTIAEPKRRELERKAHEEEITRLTKSKDEEVAKVRAEAEAERERLKGMSAMSGPTDFGNEQPSEFKQRMMGIKPPEGEEGSKVPDVPIGEGSIAHHAAQMYIKNGGRF